jgi:hypothetical protein
MPALLTAFALTRLLATAATITALTAGVRNEEIGSIVTKSVIRGSRARTKRAAGFLGDGAGLGCNRCGG